MESNKQQQQQQSVQQEKKFQKIEQFAYGSQGQKHQGNPECKNCGGSGYEPGVMKTCGQCWK